MAKITAHSERKAQNAALLKTTEEGKQPTLEKDPAFLAGTSNH